jgi:carbonic anhydrase
LGLIENWLRNIRDVQRLHHEELEKIEDVVVKRRRLVELNVQEQCVNLFKTSFVQHRLEETDGAFPMIHGVVYELKEGILKELELDLVDEQRKFKDIYRLIPTKIQK